MRTADLIHLASGMLAALGALGGWSSPTFAQTFHIAVDDPTPSPDGNGMLSFFNSPPIINDAGQVAFFAGIDGTANGGADNEGWFRSQGNPPILSVIVREGSAPPDGSGTFLNTSGPVAMNGAGDSVFRGVLTGTTQTGGIFRRNAVGQLVQIARVGQVPPDGNGLYANFSNPLINDAGQTAFTADIAASNPFAPSGVYRSTGVSTTLIARVGNPSPTGGTFNGFSPATINSSGQVAFVGATVPQSNTGIFRGNGSSIVKIVQNGDPGPNGGGTFHSFHFSLPIYPAINDAGQVAFLGNLTGACGGFPCSGIFRGDGSTLTQMVRTGDPAPAGTGNFGLFGDDPYLNNAGQVAFTAVLINTTESVGVFRANDSSVQQIARSNQVAPGSNGSFSNFNPPMMNDAGQVVFLATLTNTAGGSTDNQGVFWYDDSRGLLEVVRKGNSFLGSTVTFLSFISGGGFNNQPQASALYSDGQVVFVYELLDGQNGVAVWTPPSTSVPGDINGNGSVDVDDLLAVIVNWGPCGQCTPIACPADVNLDCAVDVDDLLLVIVNWG